MEREALRHIAGPTIVDSQKKKKSGDPPSLLDVTLLHVSLPMDPDSF